jgi:hypothetical protein
MKATAKVSVVIVFVGMCIGMGAQESPGEAAGIPPGISEKKVSELTVGDFAALAALQSVERQERHYERAAALESFILPGLGQLKVGDTKGGSLHIAGQIALVAGAAFGSYMLLPLEIRDTGLSRSERRDLVREYKDSDEEKLYASAGVMAGGMVLSVVHSLWAAKDAKRQAEENIESGKVTFEPSFYIGSHGMGPCVKLAW